MASKSAGLAGSEILSMHSESPFVVKHVYVYII
jgi:hypothetical protein